MDVVENDDTMDDDLKYDVEFIPIEPHPCTRKSSQAQSQTAKRRNQKRPKVQSDWSPENISKLIKAVEERRMLWDKDMPEYKLPTVSAWQEIVDVIGNYTPAECKAKWNNLRVTFNRSMGKFRSTKSGQGTDETKQITWQFFKSMLFLEASNVRQSTESASSMPLVIIIIVALLSILVGLISFICVRYHWPLDFGRSWVVGCCEFAANAWRTTQKKDKHHKTTNDVAVADATRFQRV